MNEWGLESIKLYLSKLIRPMICIQKCPNILCWICFVFSKVKVLFKFTKAGGNRSEEDTRKLYQIVGALPEDKPVLKFWMTGLSVQYKTHMFTVSQTKAQKT